MDKQDQHIRGRGGVTGGLCRFTILEEIPSCPPQPRTPVLHPHPLDLAWTIFFSFSLYFPHVLLPSFHLASSHPDLPFLPHLLEVWETPGQDSGGVAWPAEPTTGLTVCAEAPSSASPACLLSLNDVLTSIRGLMLGAPLSIPAEAPGSPPDPAHLTLPTSHGQDPHVARCGWEQGLTLGRGCGSL